MITDTKPQTRFAATYTCDHDNGVTGPLYYFALTGRSPGPYRVQHHVEAILDIADDGSLAGVELIDNMSTLPDGAQSSDAKDALLREAAEVLAPFIPLADEIDQLGHEPGSTCLHRLKADDLRRARSLLLKLTEATKP